jgi:hypothetical protein
VVTAMMGAWLQRVCVALVVLGVTIVFARAQDFPFDQEMLLEAQRLPDSRRVPMLEIQSGGRANVDLWCHNAIAEVAITGGEIKFTFTSATPQGCTAERIELDQAMAKGLLAVTSWRQEDDIVVLTGPAATFRFRLSTH